MSAAAGDALVLYALQDGVVTLTLNDCARMNPLADGLIDALEPALQRARHEVDMRALVLTAKGRGFSVGADLADYRALLDAPASSPSLGAHVGWLMARMQPLLLDLNAWPVPVVCAVNGVAAGGGGAWRWLGTLSSPPNRRSSTCLFCRYWARCPTWALRGSCRAPWAHRASWAWRSPATGYPRRERCSGA